MREVQEKEAALTAADTALNGRRARGVSRFASIELRGAIPESGAAWELASMFAVGFATLFSVVALWLY